MLLTKTKRKAYFKTLGLGEYNKANILKFQKKYFTRKKDLDGLYGTDTDNLLRHVYNVKTYTKNFKPQEFKCECNGRYCTGYPTYMKPAVLVNIQKIRNKYGKPVHVTSGLRCRGLNSRLVGSSSTSRHLSGLAIDFYISGITNALSRRKSLINFARKLANHHYSYCHGYSSGGYSVSAPNMGTAIHTDANNGKVITQKKAAKLTPQEKAVAWAVKIANDNTYGYKKWTSNVKTHQCPICHPKSGKGWNCIGFVTASFFHGAGIKTIKCSNAGLGNNKFFTKVTQASWRARNGKAWKLISNNGKKGGKSIAVSKLQKGDVLICYDGKGIYKHLALYIGNGKIVHSANPKDGILTTSYSGLAKRQHVTRAFRYTGK
ncbi:MAG: hypothetical protein GX777_03085 [Fastidiosipila sp.]|nr:hypothetical protein [Fastidiosipila sp.]